MVISVALLFILASLAALAYPFVVSKKESSRHSQSEDNIAYYKEEIDALEQKVAAGEVTEDVGAELIAELKKNLILEEQQSEITGTGSKPESVVMISVVIGLVVILGVAIFGGMRWSHYIEQKAWVFLSSGDPQRATFKQEGQAVLESLELKRKFAGDDINNLMLAARTSFAIEDYAYASSIYEKVIEQVPTDIHVLAQAVEVMFLRESGALDDRARFLAEKVLDIDPEHARVNNFMAIHNYKNENYIDAIKHWKPVLNQYPQDSQDYKQVMQWVAQAYEKAGRPSLDKFAEANAAKASVRLSVDIDPEVRSKVNSKLSVFIFAKDAEGGRVPLAVKRMTVGDLPVSVTLTERDAMMASRSLAKFTDITVGARISVSGQPIAQSGDWESPVKTLSLVNGKAETSLTISTMR